MDSLSTSLKIAGSGMEAQATRLRIVSENIANSRTTGDGPGADPYRRKTVTFDNRVDREAGIATVQVSRVGTTPGAFRQDYEPGHPAADARGYVKRPNVDSFVEMMDMREAQRSYSANLSVMETSRGMLSRTIEALRG